MGRREVLVALRLRRGMLTQHLSVRFAAGTLSPVLLLGLNQCWAQRYASLPCASLSSCGALCLRHCALPAFKHGQACRPSSTRAAKPRTPLCKHQHPIRAETRLQRGRALVAAAQAAAPVQVCDISKLCCLTVQAAALGLDVAAGFHGRQHCQGVLCSRMGSVTCHAVQLTAALNIG